MIKSKGLLVVSFLLFCVAVTMTFFVPKDDVVLSTAGAGILPWLPVYLNGKWVIVGIIGVVSLIVSMYLLVKGLHKWHKRLVILVLVLFGFSPYLLTTAYQETVAKGIDAISYNGNGACQLKIEKENELNGDCTLTLHNHKNKEVTFEIEFVDTPSLRNSSPDVSLMNQGGPYKVTLKANEKKEIHLKEVIELKDSKPLFESLDVGLYRIKLIDGDKNVMLYRLLR